MTNSPATPRLSTYLLAGLGVLAMGAFGLMLWDIREALLIFFSALLLAIFFHGLANTVHRLIGWRYLWSLIAVLTLIIGVLTLTGLIIGPGIADQASQLATQLPQAYNQALDQLRATSWGAHAWQLLQQGVTGAASNVQGLFVTLAGGTFHGCSAAIFAIIIGLFLAAQPDLYRETFLLLIPRAHRERCGDIMHQIGQTLWRWLLGQLVTMTSVGVLIGIGLTILHVPLPGTLGILAGLLAFIPSLGPIISVIPALLLGLSISPATGLGVVITYLVVQLLESNVITPIVQQRAVELPPALILSAELVAGLLFGVAGLMLATPMVAAAIVLVRTLYVEDTLGENLAGRGSVAEQHPVEDSSEKQNLRRVKNPDQNNDK